MTGQDLWPAMAGEIESVLIARFGVAPARASVSFLGVDRIDVLRFRLADRMTYCSLGMARHPMLSSAPQVVDISGPRAELLVEVNAADGESSAAIWQTLAIFAAAPAVEGVVYGPGITVDSGRALVPGSQCTGALVVESQFADLPTPGGLVSILQLLPATPQELAWGRVHGVRELRRRFAEQHVDVRNLARCSVSFSG